MSHPFALLFEKEVEKPAPAVRSRRRERFVVGKSLGEWGTAGGSSFLFMSLHLSSRFKYVNYPLGLAAGVCSQAGRQRCPQCIPDSWPPPQHSVSGYKGK